MAFQSFSRGWDPDNVTAPLITSVGDLITLPCLFLAVKFLIWKNGLFGIIVVICAVCGMYIIKNKPKITYSIVKDSFFILMGSASLSIGSGLLINYRINQFIAMSGLFILLPPFLEGGGALGGILSSRLSTSLHLGMIESTWKPTREAVEDFLVVVLLGITLFPFIGGLAYMASTMLGLQFPPVYQVMKACFYAGLLIAVVVNFLSYYAAVASTRFGLDPDSVVIPMISGFMDFLGTNCLLIVLIALEIA